MSIWRNAPAAAVLERVPLEKTPSAFDYNMGNRTAIYVPFPQAVPARPVIDRDALSAFSHGKCGICAKKMPGRRDRLRR